MNLLIGILRSFVKAVVRAVPTILGVVVIGFFLIQIAPGDAADALAAESGVATQETMDTLRHSLGLDSPLLAQLVAYLGNLVRLNLGFSQRYGVPVAQLINERLPGTLTLMMIALGAAIIVGVTLGVVMASFSGRLPDRMISVISLLFYSVPNFWVGLMLIVVFSVKMRWFPSGGSGTIGADLSGFAAVADKARFMVLPAVSLAIFYVAIYARLTRASVLEVKSQDFVRTAAAKGLSPLAVTVRHVLRNALIPITTMAGLHIGSMLGGAVVVETVYNWPGLGRLAYEAIMGRDYTLLLGIFIMSSLLVITVNICVDILHTVLDPRIGVRS